MTTTIVVEQPDLEKQQPVQVMTASRKRTTRFAEFCSQDVDKDVALWPLLAYTAVAGYASAISFCATWTYAAFQSANSLMLGLAIGSSIAHGDDPTPSSFHITEKHAVTSLLSFYLGGLLAQLIPKRFGPRHRGMLVCVTLFQAVLTAGAAIASADGPTDTFADGRLDPKWQDAPGYMALALLSASCGLQGVIADSIGTNLGVTVVLTSLWVQLASQPFYLRFVKKREEKFAGIVVMILGGALGRIIAGALEDWSALSILTGIRVVIALSWFACKRDTPPADAEAGPPQLPSTPQKLPEAVEMPSLPASGPSSGQPSRNVSHHDFSRITTISSSVTVNDPASSHRDQGKPAMAPLHQSDTINSTANA